MNMILQTNNFIYKKVPIKKLEPIEGYFVTYCEYLFCNKDSDSFHFLLRTHDKIEILSYTNYDMYFYITSISNISELINFIKNICKEQKIIKINGRFTILKKQELDLVTTTIFKINNESDLIISYKFHENLISKQVNIDDILNTLFTTNEIITYKKQC